MAALKIDDEKYENVRFQCGTFDESEFTSCLFLDVDFEGVWVNETIFKRCQFNQTLFYDIQAYGAKFDASRFSNVQFKGANLAKADFSDCVFVDTYLGADNIGTVTDISGACFAGVDFKYVTFIQVTYDANTIFPVGFDPQAREGLILA
jgi:uncharacterized protein YjbI with pentapeptide repeats